MDTEKLEQILDVSIHQHDFSGVVYVAHRNKVLCSRASGYADRSNSIPNTLETRFGIASGTKFFTALAVGKLIETGKLDFSTKLKECLPRDIAKYGPEATIRHLLTHTSGVADYYDEENGMDVDNFTLAVPWYELKGPRDYLAVFPQTGIKFAPGERFSYSNGGYILLGVVIEELTGMKYRDFVKGSIFDEVGMSQSGYFASNQLPEKTALGYVDSEGGWRTNVFDLPIIGASDGGAYTTVHDLNTLWKAFWQHQILPKEMVEVYAAPHFKAETEGADRYYGHGLWIREDAGREREYYIVGRDAGVSFKSLVRPDSELQITVISNSTQGARPLLRDLDTVLQG